MPLFHLFIIAVLQGITEFLPISSSGHLILLPQLTGWEDQGRMIDVAVHVGTLGAVVLYFWTDVGKAVRGVPKLIRWQIDGPEAWLALCLAIATVPAVLFGILLVLTGIDESLRSIKVIGWTTLVFGLLLYVADTRSPQSRPAERWGLKHALILGLWQMLALVPGTSRSGITITGARFLGYARADAAKLSMLMSVPVILASGLVSGIEVAAEADLAAARDGAIAAGFAFLAAYLTLVAMFRLLKRLSFTPYVIYRIGLGSVLLWIAYT